MGLVVDWGGGVDVDMWMDVDGERWEEMGRDGKSILGAFSVLVRDGWRLLVGEVE